MWILLIIVVVVIWYFGRDATKPTKSNPLSASAEYDTSASSPLPPITATVTTTVRYEESDFRESDRDAGEGSFWEVSDPVAVTANLRFNYTDGDGRRTNRDVSVRQLGDYGADGLIIGHCRLRNATRTFRTDRISEAIDLDTGEVLDDVVAFLRARYRESANFSLDTLVNEYFDVFRVLLYVGKADGQLRSAERSIIADACRELTSDGRITDESVLGLLKSFDVPSLTAFKQAVGRIAKQGTPPIAQVLDICRRIVATQKAVHPSEAEALDYIEKKSSATSGGLCGGT